MTLGIVGYGRFGQFAAAKLSRSATVVVHDPAARRRSRAGRVDFVGLPEAARCDVVVLAVPVSALREVLRAIRPHLRPGSLVVDVCAVKAEPVRWMRELLPRSVDVVGTHPLFGPDSASRSLRGKIIVLCPIRIAEERLQRWTGRLEKAGLKAVILAPRVHDRLMAETIFLTQLVGRAVREAGLRRWPAVTSNYRYLLSIVETARRDTDLLFLDMLRYSGESRRVLRGVRRGLLRLSPGTVSR